MMEFVPLKKDDPDGIAEMSAMASAIVREHFDPLIGREQNDYMIARFQTPDAIRQQLENGYRYFFVRENGRNIGFLAFYAKKDCMYLSKFYLYKSERGKGFGRKMLAFVTQQTKNEALPCVELNVNRFNSAVKVYQKQGFEIIREEKNDIGSGFIMDDYVMRLDV